MHTAKRLLVGAVGVTILAALVPGAKATTAAVQENVRHIKTVPGSTGGHAVVEGNRLYVGAYGLGMRLFDITDPADPKPIGQFFPGPQPSQPDNDIGVRADAVPDAAVFDGRHIVTLNGTSRTAGAQQTEFLDWTDPADPKVLWRFTDATNGEAHNGDIVDVRRLWLPSGGGNGLRIFDLNPLLQQPPAAPARLSMNNPVNLWRDSPYRQGRPIGPSFSHIHDIEVYTDLPVLLPEAEWVDQDGDLAPDPTYGPRDLAFLAEGGSYLGNGNTGSFFVVDITDPAAPVALLRFLHPSSAGHHPWRYFHEIQLLDGDKHVGFVSDEDLHNGCDAGGVMSVRFSEDYTSATELDEWFIGTGTPAGVCSAHVFSSQGDYVFMGAYQAGLQVIDFTDPANLKRAGQYIPEGGNSWGALAAKGYVYVGDFGGRGLDVFQFIPNPVAKGVVKVNNPAVTTVPGITETVLENTCDPATPANGVDGLIVPIPADKRDGTHVLRSVGSGGGAPYNLNVYFYNADCAFIAGGSHNSENPDELGPIPEEAAFGVVDLVQGPPMWVYAQIDP